MAVLTDEQRAEVDQVLQSDLSAKNEVLGALTKAELRAAVNAVDQWVEDNKLSFNNAFPQPAKAELTAYQKSRILTYVVSKRFEVEA